MRYRILIVEDDLVIAESIKKHLEMWNCDAHYIKDFNNVLGEFTAFDPQLVLMDISLPFFNGYHWCAEIRRLSGIPIIFISSAADNMNIVMAINMGGDDFIAKPFDLDILMAKIHAMLRRTYDLSGQTGLLSVGNVILNTNDATLSYRDQRIELSRNEYRILQILMENKGRIVSRNSIMTRLWENDSYVDENTLSVNMTRLRHKLSEAGLDDFITTKKGFGFEIG